jgi:hypothetical protein
VKELDVAEANRPTDNKDIKGTDVSEELDPKLYKSIVPGTTEV